ncbi:hypothetical protein, partial [Bartonella queenslandensis]|uniref:hypothetical protein n=1 Tax=Bartonella queenslandensis TaxID=481138 RepID=UPI001AEBDE37
MCTLASIPHVPRTTPYTTDTIASIPKTTAINHAYCASTQHPPPPTKFYQKHKTRSQSQHKPSTKEKHQQLTATSHPPHTHTPPPRITHH